jgi:hypothetical protein
MRIARALGLLALIVCLPTQAQVTIQNGRTLSQLINNLYGGNGIQLKQNSHAAHFGDSEDFQQFSETLQKTLQARPVFPVPSSVGIVSFQFNEATGTYERVQTSFGPILAERATTSGKGHVNFGFGYTVSDFSYFNGADDLDLTLRHCATEACTGGAPPETPFLNDTIRVNVRMKLKSQVLTTSATYGLTDRLDIGVVVPYIRNDLNVSTHGSIVRAAGSLPAIHEFDPLVETSDQMAFGHAIGIGDVIARAKLQIPLRGLPIRGAVLTDITLPSGDKENFLGTGDLRVRAAFIASASGKRFSPHLNLGYEWNAGTTALSNVDYRGGLEVVATPRLTLAADVVGVIFPSAEEEFRARALDGQSLIGRSMIDGAVGAKWSLGTRSLLVFNLLFPLNDEGIRPGNAITIGLQTGS